MKTFFSNFFSTLLALVIFTIGGVITLIVIIVGITVSISATETVKKIDGSNVLIINTSQVLSERNTNDGNINLSFDDDEQIGIEELKHIIETAKTDKSISAILIKNTHTSNSIATCNYIYESIKDFKKSGKPIYAYGNYNEKDYYISSIADKIYVNHTSIFEWKGLYTQLLFFKKMMNKLDIEAQIFYAGKFKSATEPFRKEKMSDENRIQIKEFLNSFQSQILHTISTNRKIPIDKLQQYADELSVTNLQTAQKLGFIDGIAYEDEVETKLKKKLNINEDLKFIELEKYKKHIKEKTQTSDHTIAVLYAEGTIINGTDQDGDDVIASDDLVKTIHKIEKDDDIEAVVLRINSPGGDAQASNQIWRALKKLKEKKTLIVSMGRVAASGGYYIACAGDSIIAEPFTITGSIGVFTIIPNFSSFLNNKLGVSHDEEATSPHAVFGVFKPLTPLQKIYLQNHIEEIYTEFKSVVADGRHKKIEDIDAIAQGRVWSAPSALKKGLIDKIGYLQDACKMIATMKKWDKYKIKELPVVESEIERLLNKITKKRFSSLLETPNTLSPELNYLQQQITFIKNISNQTEPQTRLPFMLDIK